MSKKDLLDRLSRPGDPRPRPAPTPAAPPVPSRPKGAGEEITRVSSGVVRRRRAADSDGPEPEVHAPAAAADVIVRRRPGAAPEPARVEPARAEARPVPAARPADAPRVEAPAETEPVAPPVAEVVAPSEAPVEAAPPAPAEREAVAAPPAPEPVAEVAPTPPPAELPEPTATRAVVVTAPEGRREGVVRRSVVDPARPADAAGDTPRFRGLGSAVVVPPPGYDPTNPDAFRAQQARTRPPARPGPGGPRGPGGPGGDARGPGAGGRRRVADSSPAAAPVAAPAAYTGGGGGEDSEGRSRRSREAAAMEQALRQRPRRRKKSAMVVKSASPQPKAQKRKIRIDGAISVGQLAHELSVKAPLLIKKLMEMGTLATVNEMLDAETASVVASEFEYEIENVGFKESEYLQHVVGGEEDENQVSRPPVVTIMGHVDHGKTTLLDSIRKTKVAAGEAGGITQHIGAYQVEWKGRPITFLDTPGHAAFSAMRARGAGITDIVVLVVAADDGVQPQTAEAINHAKAAGVPIVVAINKIDKPGVNPDAIKQRLGEYELIPEEWGGETLFAAVSALKHQGIDDLLEVITLQADMLDLRANPDRHAEGTVIEAKVERGRGPVATVLVQQGKLSSGDHVVIGSSYGKVRAMMDFRGKPIKTALPATPVEIFGLSQLPNVGDSLAVVANEKNARTLAEHREQLERDAAMARTRRRNIDDLRRIAGAEAVKTLLVVLKADVQGSLEALKQAILNIKVDGCEVRVLHDGVGAITESDVNLMAGSDGLLIGFNVKPDARARKVADELGVKPETYDVIYHVLDRVQGALTGMLEPVYEETYQGTAEVRALFNISKIGTIAGCFVQDGKIGRNQQARVMREGREIWKGDIATLKRFKDDVREVQSNYECGISLQGFDALQIGDQIQAYAMVRVDHPGTAS